MLKKVFTYLILSLTIFTNSQSFVFSQIYNWTKTEISADWKNSSYYCWVLTVNGILIAWGLGVSHANPVWKFKIDFVKKNWEKAWGK